MPNPLDRLRELWAKKPWTKPPKLMLASNEEWHLKGGNLDVYRTELELDWGPDIDIILSLAEMRLMDLLPDSFSLRRSLNWYVETYEGDAVAVGGDRLSALIAWAESDACKETQ